MVETVLAFTLLALGGLALLNLMPGVWFTSQSAEQQLQAATLAQSLLEKYRSQDLTSFTTYDWDPVESAGTVFHAHVEAQNLPPHDRLKKLVVTVRWEGKRKKDLALTRQVVICRVPR
jgi:Tfp pilus assembly protein PilV